MVKTERGMLTAAATVSVCAPAPRSAAFGAPAGAGADGCSVLDEQALKNRVSAASAEERREGILDIILDGPWFNESDNFQLRHELPIAAGWNRARHGGTRRSRCLW